MSLMELTNFNIEQLFGFGEDSNPLLWLIWIIPLVLFMFYGQRIQLKISASEISKSLEKLKKFKTESRTELIDYIKTNLKPKNDPTPKLDRFFEHFTIMPVDLDPNGLVPKIRHIVRSREDYIRSQVRTFSDDMNRVEASKIENMLEVVTLLQMFHKVVRHFYLTAKKQNNYPLILPLQMMIPFIMEEAEALKGAVPALKQGQPIGDGIGSLVIGKMMLDTKKNTAAFETVWSESDYEGRKLLLLKAQGPTATVGRLGDAVQKIVLENKPDIIVMVDAALKLEGEESASIAQGFGASIGGIGTERYQIEEVATKYKIPTYAIIIKQSVKEAITLMTKKISDTAENVTSQIYECIKENTKVGQSALVIGVGNTAGISQ